MCAVVMRSDERGNVHCDMHYVDAPPISIWVDIAPKREKNAEK